MQIGRNLTDLDEGFLSAGYTYITLGGIGYAEGATPGGNITRNASGHLQADPIKFPAVLSKNGTIPAGNEALRALSGELRAMGFRWGSYTEAGTTGCNGAQGASEGYEEQDAALFVDDWGSEYLMVDSCGVPEKAAVGPPSSSQNIETVELPQKTPEDEAVPRSSGVLRLHSPDESSRAGVTSHHGAAVTRPEATMR